MWEASAFMTLNYVKYGVEKC